MQSQVRGGRLGTGMLLGVVLTLLAIGVLGFAAVTMGWLPANADKPPSGAERWAALTSLKTTIVRESASLSDPLPQGEPAQLAGVKVYAANCSMCHGTSANERAPWADAFYIPAPTFAKNDVSDDPAGETYWKIKHGIRYTAMPAFDKRLTETETWQVAQFLKHMAEMSPAVKAAWTALPNPKNAIAETR